MPPIAAANYVANSATSSLRSTIVSSFAEFAPSSEIEREGGAIAWCVSLCDSVAHIHNRKISIISVNCLGSSVQQLNHLGRLAALQF